MDFIERSVWLGPLESYRYAVPAEGRSALENLADLVASCESDRSIGIDHCWIKATQ
ncbi:MAG TPA: hypothetical protein VJX68_05070 [Candidatus Binatus sp.]|uniref:hypothetical protein n=1 Tax=Candidatus Binatus sp. TaxID=2811406 RepID=UPI002B467A4C|nr:hypothetical protein [Candidatus Binatus sp.]HKN12548.1 hypothetical protein [Candidatus Binatus sp.]